MPNYNLYMIVGENNVACIKGIENAGFVRCGKCEKEGKCSVGLVNEE